MRLIKNVATILILTFITHSSITLYDSSVGDEEISINSEINYDEFSDGRAINWQVWIPKAI